MTRRHLVDERAVEAGARPVVGEREERLDWTVNPTTGRANSSPEFRKLVGEVARLIRSEAQSLIGADIEWCSRLIVAQLAHVHGLAPLYLQHHEHPAQQGEERLREALEDLLKEFTEEVVPAFERAQKKIQPDYVAYISWAVPAAYEALASSPSPKERLRDQASPEGDK